MEPAIHVEGLRKAYGAKVALDDLSFAVGPGEVFGLLGPNGAGKTTALECLVGLRRPDGGRISVLGRDPWRERVALAQEVGVQLQESVLPDGLRVGEAVALFASFYPRTREVGPLLEALGLVQEVRTPFARLSGGQKQRLFLALALLHDPKALFLDELTTGLDPQGRRAVFALIRELRGEGKAVLLTTHQMGEAEALCDRVAILLEGRLVAQGTPAELVRRFAGPVRLRLEARPGEDWAWLCGLPGVLEVGPAEGQVAVVLADEAALGGVLQALTARGIPLAGLTLERPTLEEVFLALTGRPLRGQSEREEG
ncbi:ABC transporter ATP-binding protein [Thermus islandicus]|uniref:ABC transporter ATP-binding protein n=1 Tax=Thermus islandicus TaxID=540988 RepID=UPI0003B2EC2E|nr:ABC transporter ATP-binding protein [Thermus islandicus]